KPAVEVLVCTVRALKLQSGQFQVRPGKPLPKELTEENLPAISAGATNLQAHLDIIRKFGVPCVVAVNRFPEDSVRELELVCRLARQFGAADAVVSEAFAGGSEGTVELAKAVVENAQTPSRFQYLYSLDIPLEEKLNTIATSIYGADGIELEPTARVQLASITQHGFGNLPICIAKTQYSLSHDPKRLGRPAGFRLPIREVRLAAGAGYVYAIAGDIRTMPGLPANPAALKIDLDEAGRIIGLK
ncbi:MAG: formate--tetrahydrofolate ligase, partial [Planctomycetaceae bacterium]